MRIISGQLKGRKLYAPTDDRVRPTADRTREALFNILGGEIVDSWVLDAFAGVGTVGIEALSRGAIGCDFIELDKGALSYLKRNLKRIDEGFETRIFNQPVAKFVGNWNESDSPYELVFADPPYNIPPDSVAGLLRPTVGGLLVLETASQNKKLGGERFPDYELKDVRDYGRARLYFLKPA